MHCDFIDVSNRTREIHTMNQTAFPVLPVPTFPVSRRLHTPTPPEVEPDPAPPPGDDPDPGPGSPPVPEREPDSLPDHEPPAGDPPDRSPPMHASRTRR